MSFLRPPVRAALFAYREVLLGTALAALGAWVANLGGYFYSPLGLLLLVMGVGFAILGWRRQRFQQSGDAPGIVHVTEGQIAYFGPRTGGFIALPDLVELRLLTLHGRRVWFLQQADGQQLYIPVAAQGADALFDAFAALPDMDSAALVAALGGTAPAQGRALAPVAHDAIIWQRKAAGVIVR